MFARDVSQRTPLHSACFNGNMEVAMALVDRGADVHARDVSQRTPLHCACISCNMEVAMALVDRGADVDARDVGQNTPLLTLWRFSFDYRASAMALIRKGANIHARDVYGKAPKYNHEIIDLFNRLWYATPLMQAMLDRDMNAFETLLDDDLVNVNADIGDGYGWTVLHIAVDLHLGEYVTRLLQHDCVDVGIKHEPRSQTALHIACAKGDVAMVRLLREHFVLDPTSISSRPCT